MKKIALALVLAAGFAQADEWLEAVNKTGGKVILSQVRCEDKKEGRVVMSTTENEPTLFGCWWFIADQIHIRWSDNSIYTYSPKIFVYRTDEKK